MRRMNLALVLLLVVGVALLGVGSCSRRAKGCGWRGSAKT